LRGIARRSKAEWSPEQAERYGAAFDEAFNRLASFPGIGRGRPDLPSELQVLPVGHHLVLYQIIPTGVFVLRVIHQRMDLGQVALS